MRRVFGIRHHGPGSARSLRLALAAMNPDVVLIEGPPDANDVLPLASHAQMTPPVALLVYRPDEPRRAVYYPFAVFSPEWQAMLHALEKGVALRFMDLPQANQLVDGAEEEPAPIADDGEVEGGIESVPINDETTVGDEIDPEAWRHALRSDPLRFLAEAAGYSDGERFWEHLVEQRRDGVDLFAGILEAMTALRAEAAPAEGDASRVREERREASMRQSIRAAEKEGFQRIAIVCGAWHAPALVDLGPARPDAAILKGLPKAKVAATWVPWTHGRLAIRSGYGAGVNAPGWYHHLFTNESEVTARWLSRVARLLRDEDFDASSAEVVDAVRLAEALAALRDRPLPGLPELDEAAETVLCHGSAAPMQLVREQLVVGEVLGAVPDDTPMVPLAQDLERERRRLRMKAEATNRDLDLDLRGENDLARSHLLHRLNLIGVHWGELQPVAAGKKGTFHEVWKLRWDPELAVALIEAGVWGNTLVDAATARAISVVKQSPDLPALTALLADLLLADIPEASRRLVERIEAEAALASDVGHLLAALPPMTGVLRYGDVRKTDRSSVEHVIDGLVARIVIGLPGACASLDDDAASAMLAHLIAADAALRLARNEGHLTAWHAVLAKLLDQNDLHGLLAGRAARLLLEAGVLDGDEAARRAGLALSSAVPPASAAAWVDGFLRGSGLLVLHDDRLWRVLDEWVSALSDEAFPGLLPLLRRTFSTFSAPERRQMGERARRGSRSQPIAPTADGDFDQARADAVLPLLAALLGLAPALEKDAIEGPSKESLKGVLLVSPSKASSS